MKQINILKKAAGALSILLLLLSLAACGNAISENNEDKVVEPVETTSYSEITIKGEIKLHGAAPSRAASTSFDSDYTWQITAMKKELMETDAAPTAADTITGMRTKVTSTNYFTIDLPSAGDWVFVIYGFAGTYTQSTLPSTSAAVFMCYDDSHTIKADGTDQNLTFYPTVYAAALALSSSDSTITGSINLVVCCDAANVSWVSATLSNALAATDEPVIISPSGFTNGKSSLVANNIPAGFYTARIYFDDYVGNSLYACTEAITVYPGLTTDTWFGNAPYISEGEFNLTSDFVEKYGTEPVPNTQTLLYNYSVVDGNADFSNYTYYLVDDAVVTNPVSATAVETTACSTFYDFTTFDADGNLFLLRCRPDIYENGDTIYNYSLISNKEGWIEPSAEDIYTKLGISYEYTSKFIIDTATNIAYSYTDHEADKSVTGYPTLISSNGSELPSASNPSTSFSFNVGGNMEYGNFTIGNNKAFLLQPTENGSSFNYSLYIHDVSDNTEEKKSLDLQTILGVSESEKIDIRISDMLYQDGNLYILYKQLTDYSFQSKIFSRGAVIKYNISTGISEALGLTSSKIPNNDGYVLQTFSQSGNPMFTDETCTTPYLPEIDAANITVSTKYPEIIRPEENEKAFYGPTKFIAVKPKKLVISDEGYVFYTGNDNILRYKNLNRVVYVDLENFVISDIKNINGNLSMSENDTSNNIKGSTVYLNTSDVYYTAAGPFQSDSCYLGIINDDKSE